MSSGFWWGVLLGISFNNVIGFPLTGLSGERVSEVKSLGGLWLFCGLRVWGGFGDSRA